MTLGWQGFSFEHPEDWAPDRLTGTRAQGFLRLAAGGGVSAYVRWQRAKRVDAPHVLGTYLDRLRRDAKRARKPFDGAFEGDDDTWTYRYQGTQIGRGAMRLAGGRLFFLEVASDRKTGLDRWLGPLVASFRSEPAELEAWSVHGLDVRLPAGLRVVSSEFLAGRTRLDLARFGLRVRAERWGLAEQLLARHDLVDWARASLRAPRAQVTPEHDGLRLEWRSAPWARSVALLRHTPETNQITIVTGRALGAGGRPQWTWLV